MRAGVSSGKPLSKVMDELKLQPITLDIYFHGTFLLWFRETTVYAMAPMVHGHSYGLGSYGSEAMMGAGEYTLSVKSQSLQKTALPSPKHNVVLFEGKASSPPDYESCYAWLRMPEPNEVTPLRNAARPFFIPGKTTNDHKINPLEAPLVTRFRYLAVTKASLYPALWTLPPDNQGKPVQLHVFAEPAFEANPQHIGHGLQSLCELFTPALDLTLAANANTTVDPSDPAEYSIAERLKKPFASISNCMHINMIPGAPA